MILYPSSGGRGIMLNTARATFIHENINQNCTIKSLLSKYVSHHANLIYTSMMIVPIILNTMFVAGHAKATRSSSLILFL